MASERTFEDLDLSKDEVKRLGEALKDEKFRKMLVEYAEEISDPENRRKAEEEIAMMENERGMNVQFINPEPGYVMKTTVNGTTKAFVNICQNDKIEKPKAQRESGPDGKGGLMWQIPHSFAPPKDDLDKSKEKCQVFDVVFHPDTYRMATTNLRFRKLVEDTALDGIEQQFSVKLDKKNVKYPKMKFKGMPTATVIRERIPHAEPAPADPTNIMSQMPYPYDNTTSTEKAKARCSKQEKNKPECMNGNAKENSKFTEPKYTITHRTELDMSEYRNAPDAKTSTRPTELVIKIELPLLKSAAQANLEIFEKRLILESLSPAAYKLDLPFPFPVNEDEGSAKFDKSKKVLTIILPVIQEKVPPLPTIGNSQDIESNLTSVNGNETGGSPLIEVLNDNHSKEDVNDNHVKSEETNDNDKSNFQHKNHHPKQVDFPQNVKWVMPDYQFSQDNETVSFVLNVRNVDESWIQTDFLETTTAVIQFMSMGSGCFPVYYRLCVKFPEQYQISSEHCNVDVSDDNLVFLILKEKNCRGLWDKFYIGVDETNLEQQEFLTECNLRRDLESLDQEPTCEMPVQEEANPQLAVGEMNDKKLSIVIKPRKDKNAKDEEDDEYDPPSSAEIQVIHKHPTPNLHSILKQRTLSDSSEDLSVEVPSSPHSCDGDDADPLSSSFTKRRSVSFSNYVDHASFKSFASPSSMTPVLKSKRRKQRKRQQKIDGRRRHCSEGTSSSEECVQGSVSGSRTASEDESELQLASAAESLATELGLGADYLPTIGDDEKTETTVKITGETAEESGEVDPTPLENISIALPNADNVLDFRTNQCVSELDKMCLFDTDPSDEEKCDLMPSLETSDNVDKSRNQKIVSEVKSKMEATECNTEMSKDNDSDDYDDDDQFEDALSCLSEDLSTKTDHYSSCGNMTSSGEESPEKGSSKDGESGKKEESGVETMLSWDEGEVNKDHVTKCAIQFSNTVMFDLDTD